MFSFHWLVANCHVCSVFLLVYIYYLATCPLYVENKKLFNNNITGRCSCVRVLQGQQGRADDILLQGTVFLQK